MRSIQMNNDFDFDTDTSYLQQDDAFSVNEMLSEWPTTKNAFVKRLANTLGQGAYFEALRLQDFMDLVGSTAVARPRETVTYEVHLRDRDTLLVDVAITSIAGTNPRSPRTMLASLSTPFAGLQRASEDQALCSS